MKATALTKNLVIAAGIMLLATGLSALFHSINVQEHITTIFVFAVFLISLLTDGYVYGVVSAVVGMFVINYIFTFPYNAFNFAILDNAVSAVVMVTVAVLTGMLTTKIKQNEAIKAETEREKMRANLLRAVSHDLRTPLTTIYTASSTLRSKRNTLAGEQQDAILQSIQEDAEWLMRMVENLLSVTRLDNGKIKLRKTPTILDELIDSVMTKFLARYPGREVTLDIPDEIVIIPMDAILIAQVLINLLENAVIHAHGMTMLSLRVFTQGEKAVFEVADDGCGIREDWLKRIFTGSCEIHENSADARKRNAGIGLAVCASIISAHGGEISAHNRREGGALLRFTLDTEDTANDK